MFKPCPTSSARTFSCFLQEVKKAMEKAKVKASDISVAAVNGPKMTVISGRKEVVDKEGKPHGSRFGVPRDQFMGVQIYAGT